MPVYLLHFDAPLAHARHYVGYSKNVEQRVECHRKGEKGKNRRLMEVLKERGIGFVVARVWKQGTRKLERKIKNQNNTPEAMSYMSEELTFQKLAIANTARAGELQREWIKWTVERWALKLQEETGEVAAALLNSDKRNLAEEIADVVIVCGLLAQRAGLDLGEIIRMKFNQTSDHWNSKVKL